MLLLPSSSLFSPKKKQKASLDQTIFLFISHYPPFASHLLFFATPPFYSFDLYSMNML